MDSLLAGRYRLRQRIGTGGMASVWLARDEVLIRPVAVKLIDPDLVRDQTFRERFREEARAAAALSHPGRSGPGSRSARSARGPAEPGAVGDRRAHGRPRSHDSAVRRTVSRMWRESAHVVKSMR